MFAFSFAVYTLFIVGVGIYSARYAKRSDEDYFLAGRSLGPWVAALSASASSESGWVTLGLVGWAFQSGVAAYWIIPGCCLGFMFNWFVLAGRLRDHSERVGALTIPDYLAFHFRERVPVLRVMSVIVILVAMLLYVAAQFAAAGDAFRAAFSHLDYRVGVLLGMAIVLMYTVLGGFRAACWTDFVQGLVMVGTLIVFPLYLLASHGGFAFIHDQLGSNGEDGLLEFLPPSLWSSGSALFGFLLGSGAMGINFGYPGQPHVIIRFMALRNRREAIVGGVVSVVWAAFVYWGAVTIGLIVRAMTHAGEDWTAPLAAQMAENASNAGEAGLVLAAKNLIPGVLSGMVLAAVLAAICSTADSQLVVSASSVANDIWSRLINRRSGGSHPYVNRTVVLILGIAAMLLVIKQEVQVYKYVLTYGWAILGASFGPQIILTAFWKRATYAGCIAGMLTGFLTAILWKLLYMDEGGWLRTLIYDEGDRVVEIYNLPLGFIAAMAVNILVSLALPGRASADSQDSRSSMPTN